MTRNRLNRAPSAPSAPSASNAECLTLFLQGIWAGVGLSLVTGGVVWLATSKVQARRDDRKLPRRMAKAANQESFTLGDYSSMESNADFMAQAREMESSYAARERNRVAVNESLAGSDLRGRTEMKPWLENE